MRRVSPVFGAIGLAGVLIAALKLLWPLNVDVWGACGSVLLRDDTRIYVGAGPAASAESESACSGRRREVGTLAGGVAAASVIFAVGGQQAGFSPFSDRR